MSGFIIFPVDYTHYFSIFNNKQKHSSKMEFDNFKIQRVEVYPAAHLLFFLCCTLWNKAKDK